MNSLNYLEEIKNSYLLNNDDLIDIIEKLSYIARDNGEDDTSLTELMDAISEMWYFPSSVQAVGRVQRPAAVFPIKDNIRIWRLKIWDFAGI